MKRNDPDRVLELLAVLGSSGIKATLDGGSGVGALLGRETRPHEDLDLVVALSDVPRIHEELAQRAAAAATGGA